MLETAESGGEMVEGPRAAALTSRAVAARAEVTAIEIIVLLTVLSVVTGVVHVGVTAFGVWEQHRRGR